ncbi:methyltransferase-like protein 22 isoform X2 [Papaver somniferum]|uniref:methyltransferase-like protein 22 isoform X2 n=1 Tax=Papaver somniferum TaxID=3469 RepID=UPI000E7010DE|nr:methyltransferase-like protein 22 isoform X2 [Papaver somniferum]
MEDERLSSTSSTDDENPSSKPSNRGDHNDHELVMSEVHLGCPPNFSGPYVSHFTFPFPPPEVKKQSVVMNVEEKLSCQMMNLDEDGDLVLPRRSKQWNNVGMTIQHSITSSIPSVGLQVWKAELVLADFLLNSMFSSSDFDGVVAVELGAGTDHGEEVLKNCALNVHRNLEAFKDHATSVFVREVDCFNSWPPEVEQCHSSDERFSWTPSEVEEAEGASLLLAADVIYNDDLTDALFGTLQKLMSRGSTKVLYLALEKRYNFSLNDLDVVANGYSRFKSYLKDDTECSSLENSKSLCFVGKLIDLTDIPQYVREYDRGNDVEIWQIRYVSPSNSTS